MRKTSKILSFAVALLAVTGCEQMSRQKEAPPAAASRVAGGAKILFRRADGLLALWSVAGSQRTGSANLGTIGPEWSLRGTGDFDGDDNVDLLWRRQTDGVISIWRLSGDAVASRDVVVHGPDAHWDVVHVADYNGDGRADILFRNDAGMLSIWCMNGATVVSRGAIGGAGQDWTLL